MVGFEQFLVGVNMFFCLLSICFLDVYVPSFFANLLHVLVVFVRGGWFCEHNFCVPVLFHTI